MRDGEEGFWNMPCSVSGRGRVGAWRGEGGYAFLAGENRGMLRLVGRVLLGLRLLLRCLCFCLLVG